MKRKWSLEHRIIIVNTKVGRRESGDENENSHKGI
jgi:hypothetical protein